MEDVVVFIKGHWTVDTITNLEEELMPKGKEELNKEKYSFQGKLLLSDNGMLRGLIYDVFGSKEPYYVVGKLNTEDKNISGEFSLPDLILNKIGLGLLPPTVYSANYNNHGTLNGTYGHAEDGMYYPSNENVFISFDGETYDKETIALLEEDIENFQANSPDKTLHLISLLKKFPYYLANLPTYNMEEVGNTLS